MEIDTIKIPDTIDVKVGCQGLKVEHYISGMVITIKEAEVLDLMKYQELADAFKEYEYITDDFRKNKE